MHYFLGKGLELMPLLSRHPKYVFHHISGSVTGNVSGGTESDTFSVTAAGTVTGILSGDAASDTFTFNEVPWEETGRYTLVRYGSIDATEDQKIAGDGGHVGTPNQLLYRFFSSVGMMSARWPNMDRTIVNDRVCTAITPACEHINSITQNFTAPTTGRTGQVTIVLPPGYFAPENATVQYPIVYFLHGYGMAPMDLQAIGNIMWNYMVSQSIPEARRVPKMIFVFPDGRCQGTECLRGTFYTDAPASTPNGAQMQQFLLDLDAHMHTTYRVRGDETVTVAE